MLSGASVAARTREEAPNPIATLISVPFEVRRADTFVRLAIALFLLALLSAGAEAAAPKRVLVIHSFARDFAPYNVVGNALRTELTQQMASRSLCRRSRSTPSSVARRRTSICSSSTSWAAPASHRPTW